MPKTNVDYWTKKLARNVARDEAAVKALSDAGWRVRIVWECELKMLDETVRQCADWLRISED